MDIDVVLPTLDPDIDRLDRAVTSISDQQNVDVHLIVVDDSDDDSVENYLEEKSADVRYIRGPGTTLPAALNEGVRAGDAPLVARQDADDVSSPRRLSTQARKFGGDDDLAVLGTGVRIVQPSGSTSRRHVRKALTAEDFVTGNPIVHGSVMMRRTAFEKVGGYDERFPTSEDIELWIRMIERGLKLRNTDEPLYDLHLHDDSIYADQLRATKLLGRFARNYSREQADDDVANRVLNDGEIEAVYEAMSTDDRFRFHREMAMELLRYGDRESAREHARCVIERNRTDSIGIGLLALSFAPEPFVDATVNLFRRVKNGRIRRSNG